MGTALGCGLGAGEGWSGEKITQHRPGGIRKLELPWIIGMDRCCATGNNHTVFQQDGIARILILFLNNLNNLAQSCCWFTEVVVLGVFVCCELSGLVQDMEWKRIAPLKVDGADLCCYQKPHGAAKLELCLSSPLGWRWPIPVVHCPWGAQGCTDPGLQCKLHVDIMVPISGREMWCGTDTSCPTPDDSWLSRARGFRGLLSLFFLFSILAFNQTLLLITKVFPIGRNPACNDTNFCLFMRMYTYINKSINSVSSELEKIHCKGTFGGCFAFAVKTFGCCSLSKCQARSWKSLSTLVVLVLCLWQVDVTAQGSGACAGANLPVVSSLAPFIHVSLASHIQSQCTEPGFGLQSCWSLLWRCFCCGYICVISFCGYKCVCRWNLFCPALEFLHFQVPLTGNFAHTV